MPSHSQVAARVRRDKAASPDRYCPDPSCLWRVQLREGRAPCPTHMTFELLCMRVREDLLDISEGKASKIELTPEEAERILAAFLPVDANGDLRDLWFPKGRVR